MVGFFVIARYFCGVVGWCWILAVLCGCWVVVARWVLVVSRGVLWGDWVAIWGFWGGWVVLESGGWVVMCGGR